MASHMRISDYIRLSGTNVGRQKLRNGLAIIAIGIGAASVAVMLALVFGARNFYYDQFESTGRLEEVIVNPQPGLDYNEAQYGRNCASCVKLTSEIVDKIKNLPNVAGVSEVLDVNVFEAITLDDQTQATGSVQAYQVNGVVENIFIAGGPVQNTDEQQVVIGQNYADLWGYKGNYQSLVGKQVTLSTTPQFTGEGATLVDPAKQFKDCQSGCDASEITAQQKPTNLTATIVGVSSDKPASIVLPLVWAEKLSQTQRYEITKEAQQRYTQAYTAWAQGGRRGAEPLPAFTLITENPVEQNGYSTLVVKADSEENVDAVATEIQKLGVGAATAKSYVEEQLQLFNVVSIILGIIGSVALLVAAIGVINTMVTATLERTREIGIMRALGARRRTVSRLFTLEASLLGFLGGVVGIIGGYLIIFGINAFVNDQLAQNSIPGENIIGLSSELILAIIVATTIIGMLAGMYPAYRAARLDPVEALRHN